ncbi:MAG TPA: LysM peptidoglycan-binding domain-containing protein, partial [Kofleriaceae bacterium]
MRLVIALLLIAHVPADAERHVIQKGETLQHVADAHGCSVDALLRANELRTTLVKPGTAINVPSCSLRARAQTRTRTTTPRPRPTSDTDKARAALAVIDGAEWIETKREPKPVGPDATPVLERDAKAEPRPATSISAGEPWDGELYG